MSIFRFIFYSAAINQLALKSRRRTVTSPPVWPDWAIYWTLAAINLPKSPTYLGNFCGGVKVYHFLVKSFLGNFYRHLAILFWSHWWWGRGGRCTHVRVGVRGCVWKDLHDGSRYKCHGFCVHTFFEIRWWYGMLRNVGGRCADR